VDGRQDAGGLGVGGDGRAGACLADKFNCAVIGMEEFTSFIIATVFVFWTLSIALNGCID